MRIKARDWILKAFVQTLTDEKSIYGPSQAVLWDLLCEELIAAGGQAVEKFVASARAKDEVPDGG